MNKVNAEELVELYFGQDKGDDEMDCYEDAVQRFAASLYGKHGLVKDFACQEIFAATPKWCAWSDGVDRGIMRDLRESDEKIAKAKIIVERDGHKYDRSPITNEMLAGK